MPRNTGASCTTTARPVRLTDSARVSKSTGESEHGRGDPVADGSDLSEVQRKFPTAALATLTFECAWGELGPGRARLIEFVRPKQLTLS